MSTSVCACAATRNLLSTPARNMSSDGGININHRALQSCSSATKRNTCHNISGCIWQNQNNVCQSSTSQPTDAPTGAVTSSPTDGPTRKPSESPVTDQVSVFIFFMACVPLYMFLLFIAHLSYYSLCHIDTQPTGAPSPCAW